MPAAEAESSPTVLLVCSPGGHLLQLLALRPSFEGFKPVWVTLESADVRHLLGSEHVILGHGPTNRSLVNLLRNSVLAWRLVRALRPHAIISTGAGLAVPFFVLGRLYRCRAIYVESLTRTQSLSLSGRLVYPLSTAFFVQWPELTRRRRRATYEGSIL